jgi:hypothetical protein
MMLIGILGYLLYPRQSLGRFFFPLLLAFAILFITSNTIWRPDNPDYLGYLGASLWFSSAAIGALLVKIRDDSNRWMSSAFGLAVVALMIFAPPAITVRTRNADRVTRSIAQAALAVAPRNAILVVEQDGWVAPLLYLKYAEDRRPDVVLMAVGLASSSWYWEHMYRHNPDLSRFPLLGPGGRTGRIKRFLMANSSRPIQFETFDLAVRWSDKVCIGEWLLNSGRDCEGGTKPNMTSMRLLQAALLKLGAGSPATDGLIAALTYQRGDALWKLGFPREAIEAFLAGVPARLRPERSAAATERIRTIGISSRLLEPAWKRPALLGDPGRNLFMAALLFLLARENAAARDHFAAAANTGLPEAISANR